MSKELTPLKALKDLREDAKHHLDHHVVYLNERLDIIEKALKRLVELEKMYSNLSVETAKELKALEIIKERVLEIDDFNEIIRCKDEIMLTMKEYELLKEILK